MTIRSGARVGFLAAAALSAAFFLAQQASAQAGRAGGGAAAAGQAPGRAGAAQPPGRGGAATPAPGRGSIPYDGPRHIPDTLVQQRATELQAQSAGEQWRREATLPEDWNYRLAPGVVTRQVSFYVNGGTRLQATLFLPNGFNPRTHRYPAVVVGHGINALAVGIEKYANAFAARGLVAMAIDYQSYGYSDSGSDELQLLVPDPTTDLATVTHLRAPVRIKRTNLNNVHEIDAFRAAISFLQGEPGVDPERIGVWASSNGGTVVSGLIGQDGRVKAAVIHVMGTAPGRLAALAPAGAALDDATQRVRTGQGGETTAGFSFPTNVDRYYQTRNRDVQAGAMLARVRPTTAVLFLPAERDELIGGNRTAVAGANYLNGRQVPSQVITFPGLTHFQPYAGTGFEIGATLSADWYDRFLGRAQPVGGR